MENGPSDSGQSFPGVSGGEQIGNGRRPSRRVVAGVTVVALCVFVVAVAALGDRPRAPEGLTFRVWGTCQVKCGLRVHSDPQTNARVLRQLQDDDVVEVVCQVEGERVDHQDGTAVSNLWDLLADGGWVSDLYLDTTDGGVSGSLDVRKCESEDLA